MESASAGLGVEVRDTPPEGSFDLAICAASSHALGGFPDALGGATADEPPDYGGLLNAAQAAALTPVYASVASEADWDRYEWRLILNAERAGHPALAERAARARARLALPGGRETLGFALVLLGRTA